MNYGPSVVINNYGPLVAINTSGLPVAINTFYPPVAINTSGLPVTINTFCDHKYFWPSCGHKYFYPIQKGQQNYVSWKERQHFEKKGTTNKSLKQTKKVKPRSASLTLCSRLKTPQRYIIDAQSVMETWVITHHKPIRACVEDGSLAELVNCQQNVSECM